MKTRPIMHAWIVFAVAYVASIAASVNQFKVPPALPTLIGEFRLNLALAGLMMSAFSAVGIFLAFPAGLILRYWGAERTATVAGFFLAGGSCLGALADGVWPLLGSRVVEGFGMVGVSVAIPAIIANSFPEDRRGWPMGLWVTWGPIGSMLMLNLSPVLIKNFSWRVCWWFAAILSILAALFCGLILRDGRPSTSKRVSDQRQEGIREGLAWLWRHGEIWCLGLSFGCFTAITSSMYTFLPLFLVEARGFSLADAGFAVSLIMLATLAASPLAGWLSDRFGADSRKLFYMLPFIFLSALLPLLFRIDGCVIRGFMILFGVVIGGVPMAGFSLVATVVPDSRLLGLGMAIVVMGQNLGFFIGPVLMGQLVERFGWASAGSALMLVSLLGSIAAWRIHVTERIVRPF